MKIVIVCIFTILLSLTGCNSNTIDNKLKEGDRYIESKQFQEALNCYELILNEDNNNEESKNMIKLINKYIECEKIIKNKDIDEGMEALESIKKIKNSYFLKSEIKDLEKILKEKQKDVSKLVLEYVVSRSDEEYEGKYYVNGNGKIVFAESDYVTNKPIGKDIGLVSTYVPKSSVIFRLSNIGKDPIINPRVNFKFNGMAINFEQSEEWKGISHNHGIGNWSEIRWEPPNGTTIQKGMPINMNFYFGDAMVSKQGAEMEITLSGDNMEAEIFKIPVELEN